VSLTTRLFARRTPYIIDVVDTTVPKQGGRFSWGKLSGLGRKALAGTFIALLAGSGVAAGFMSYTEKAPAARADWFSEMVCIKSMPDGSSEKDLTNASNVELRAKYITDFSAYAGVSTSMQGARSGSGGVAGDNSIIISDPTQNDITLNANGKKLQKTAYELFGATTPVFDSWYGAYDHENDDNTYFYGTGGNAYVKTTSATATDGTDNKAVSQSIASNPDNALGAKTQILGAKKGSETLLSHGAGDCISLAKSFGVGFSNLVFMMAKGFVGLTNSVYDWAISLSNDDPRNPIYQATNAAENLIVGTGHKDGLKDQLYLDFLPPILMIGAIGLFYSGVVRGRSRSAFSSALWMILATLMGFLFVTKPMIVPDAMNTVVTSVEGALNKAILGNSTSVGSSGQRGMCSLDGNANDQQKIGSVTVDGKSVAVKTSKNYVRQTQCSIWYATIYQPWVTGQFGVSATSFNTLQDNDSVLNRDPRHILKNSTITIGNQKFVGASSSVDQKLTWPLYMLAAQANAPVDQPGAGGLRPSSTNNISEVAYAQLTDTQALSKNLADVTKYRTGASAINGVWAGDDWSARQLGSGFLALIGSIATTIFILASALMLVGLQFVTIFLIATSPLFFLLGVAPGWGRRVLMRWVELVVEIVIKRIMVTLMLALFVKFFLIIVSLETAYIFKLIAIAILAFIAIFQRKKLTDMFTDAIKFGGNRDIMSGEGSSMAKGLTMAAVGAGLAALTGGASAPVTGAMVKAANLVEPAKKKTNPEPTPVPTGDGDGDGPKATATAESKVEVNVDNGGGAGGRRPVRVGGGAKGAAGSGDLDGDDINDIEAPATELLDEEDEALFAGKDDKDGETAPGTTRGAIPGAGPAPSSEYNRKAFNRKERRKARWKAAKQGALIGFAAGKSGSITPLTALNAINAGRAANELAREKGKADLAKKSAEIANHGATERGVIQLEETRRANDIAEARLEWEKTQAQTPLEIEFEDGQEPLRRSDIPTPPPSGAPSGPGGSGSDSGERTTANPEGYRPPENMTWDTDPNGPAIWTEAMDREAEREKAESRRRDDARDAADERDRTARRAEEARRDESRQREQRATEARRRTEETTRKTDSHLKKIDETLAEFKRKNGNGPTFPRDK
jgi:hypothetical protein